MLRLCFTTIFLKIYIDAVAVIKIQNQMFVHKFKVAICHDVSESTDIQTVQLLSHKSSCFFNIKNKPLY